MPTNVLENVLPLEGTPRVGARPDRRLGALLMQAGKLGAADVDRVVELQRAKGCRFGEAALHLGLVTADDLRAAIAIQYELPQPAPGRTGPGDELIVAHEPLHPRAEGLRALRTQLLIRWSNAGAGRRMLAIVSPGPREGRSYVAANLAVAFAQLGERTLVIDADLRAPRQHRLFGVPDRSGLSAVLSGRADLRAVMPLPDFGPLSLLPAGARPPNPQELLSRSAFRALLDELRSGFDVVLFDTPPAQHCADAQSVAFRAGSALVLARKDHTRLDETTGVIRELGEAGAHVVGTVFNAY